MPRPRDTANSIAQAMPSVPNRPVAIESGRAGPEMSKVSWLSTETAHVYDFEEGGPANQGTYCLKGAEKLPDAEQMSRKCVYGCEAEAILSNRKMTEWENTLEMLKLQPSISKFGLSELSASELESMEGSLMQELDVLSFGIRQGSESGELIETEHYTELEDKLKTVQGILNCEYQKTYINSLPPIEYSPQVLHPKSIQENPYRNNKTSLASRLKALFLCKCITLQ